MAARTRESPITFIVMVVALAVGYSISNLSRKPRAPADSGQSTLLGRNGVYVDLGDHPQALPASVGTAELGEIMAIPDDSERLPTVEQGPPPPLLAQIALWMNSESDPLDTYMAIGSLLSDSDRPSTIIEPDPFLSMLITTPAELARRWKEHPEYFDIARVDMISAQSSAAKSFALQLVREGVRLGCVSDVGPDLWRAYASTGNYHIHKDIVVNLHTWGNDPDLIDLAFEEAYFSRLPAFVPERWSAELNGEVVEFTRAEQITPNYPGLENALDGTERYLRRWPEDRIAHDRLVGHLLAIARNPNLDPRELDAILQRTSRILPGFLGQLRRLSPRYLDRATQDVLINPIWEM